MTDGEIIDRQRSGEGLLDVPTLHRIEVATSLADQLKAVIIKQRLFTKISSRDYVHVEGWVLLGNMCGLMPREKEITEDQDGSIHARVEIIRLSDGSVVSGASSLVGADEPDWARRPRYARRSMAVTRATGKSFRLCLSWVMSLAGFEVTPFEEMPATAQLAETASQIRSDVTTARELRELADVRTLTHSEWWGKRIGDSEDDDALDAVMSDFKSMRNKIDAAEQTKIIACGKSRRDELTRESDGF